MQGRVASALLLLLFACLGAVSGQSYANETAITPSSSTLRADQHVIAYNPSAGNFMLVYINTVIGATPAQDQTSVMGKIVDVTGAVVLDSFTIFPYANGTGSFMRKYHPAIVFNPSDGIYLVSFVVDMDENGTTSGIWGGFFDQAGDVIAPGIFKISSSNSSREAHPVATWNSFANEFAVAWDISNGRESLLGIVTFTKTVFTSSPLLFGVPNYFNKDPALFYNPGLSFYVVVWTASNPAGDNLADIWSATVVHANNATLVASSPRYLTGVLEVNQTDFNTSHADSAHVEATGMDPTFLVWEVIGKSTQHYVAAMFMSSDGGGVSSLTGVGQEFICKRPSAIISNVANGYLVMYEAGSSVDANGNTNSPNIRGSLIDGFLDVLSEFTVNSVYTNNDRAPMIAGDGANSSLIVWFHGNDAVAPDILYSANSTIGVQRRRRSQELVIKGGSQAVVQDVVRREAAAVAAGKQRDSGMEWLRSVAQRRQQEDHLQYNRQAARATPVTPPAFLAANPLLVFAGSSSTGSTGGGGGDGHASTWIGGIVGLSFIALCVLIVGVAVAVLLVLVVYKYREPITQKLSQLRMPSLPRRDNFQQFNDEDEVPGL